jgi:predicted RNA binding protein YcfA (HicA-like mRNA interferase family)
MNPRKLLRKFLASPNNVSFNELSSLVEAFGFRLARISGSHHIYLHPNIQEMLNIQKSTARPSLIRSASS